MVSIYECSQVADVKRLHQDILSQTYLYATVTEQMVLLSENLYKAHRLGNPAVQIEFSNGHPNLLGKDLDTILHYVVRLEDAQLATARCYGYKDWNEVLDRGDLPFDPDFEKAIDYLLTGDQFSLRDLLQSHPHLLNQHSVYGHQARLIHYVGSNGVEIWRQVVPHNIVDMLGLLLEMGAKPNAPHNIYGGNGNLVGLIKSSAHPWEAGKGNALLECLAGYEV
ncbi:MAG: hypothetical protein AAF694_06350 [Bacteroidota bacterium]